MLLLVFAFVLLVGCGGQLQATRRRDQTTHEQPASQALSHTGSPAPPAGTGSRVVEAVVTSVSDGDTVHANLSGREEHVRMIGVNCPEVTHPELGIEEEPYGREAKAYTEKQLLDRKVWPGLDVQDHDRYGRLLAYVRLEPPSSGSEDEARAKMVNARLLLEGYAQVMTVLPSVKYSGLFVKFQREAREQGKGLWGAVPFQAPDGGVENRAEFSIQATPSRSFPLARLPVGEEDSPAEPGRVQKQGGGSEGRVQAMQGVQAVKL